MLVRVDVRMGGLTEEVERYSRHMDPHKSASKYDHISISFRKFRSSLCGHRSACRLDDIYVESALRLLQVTGQKLTFLCSYDHIRADSRRLLSREESVQTGPAHIPQILVMDGGRNRLLNCHQ